ncbi:PREDICTED: thiol protease SEN102-like [Camelina sativa]|uniref:Thiol protease SEN102-like n=1 Tax=Camelina sativa TaxID=90675 RepID=A0ABM0XHA7_CAMSA|nr:PREDICTED: thiol protease SEN102-like [Camelina sativa]
MDQGDRDICWAICFAGLTQALHNMTRPVNQHVEISIEELINQIKPGASESFGLANLKIAIKHIAKNGILKQPAREKKSQEANAVGTRYHETFQLHQDVDADFLQARLDRYPVALILQMDAEFLALGQDGIYHMRKKAPITKDTSFHCMLLIGYGVTREGKTFFIGQNSHGEEWGCKGYAIVFINNECDIFCRQD